MLSSLSWKYEPFCIVSMRSCYMISEKIIVGLLVNNLLHSKTPVGMPEGIDWEWLRIRWDIHRRVLENNRVIERKVEKNSASVISLERLEVWRIKRIFSEMNNKVCLLTEWSLHVFTLCHDSHLKQVSWLKWMTQYMSRDCISDAREDILYLWYLRKCFAHGKFNSRKRYAHRKKIKKSPGRVTRGVELRKNEKLPGHKSEQVHHRWESSSHRRNYRIISGASMK